ncbi:MAG: mce-like protein [Nitrospirae bacterium]|nr:mce-like protein [Nitrospirota bacterium]
MYEIKKQLAWSKLKVGIVMSIALAALLLTVLFTGDISNIISKKELIKIDFRDVGGLRSGSPVWFAGIEVGAVKSIGLSHQYGTVVTIAVNRDVLGYLKKDSHATVQTMGLLGDKYVELSSGSSDAPALRPGEMLEGATETGAQEMVATVAVLLKKMDDVVGRIEAMITAIGEGQGTVSQLLKDPVLYNNLKDASKRISEMTVAMQSGKGSVGKLMGDDLLYNRLLAASESMDRFGNKLNNDQGTLNRLVEDPALYNRLLGATASLEDFSTKLSKGQGTLNRLIEDPQLYENLAQASGRLASILQTVDRGEGTAGSLIRDEELAQELKETVRELKELTADMKKNPGKYFKFSIF